MRAIDARDEAHVQMRFSYGRSAFGHHERVEVGTADTDAHHVGDGLYR